ncbi:MAG: M23 family metallopeptidase [Desulfonatronovibrionaceae bacterium]
MKAKLTTNILIVLTGVLLLGGILIYILNAEGDNPRLTLSPDTVYTNGREDFELAAADPGMGIKSVNIKVIQGDTETEVLSEEMDKDVHRADFEFELPLKEMQQGNFTVVAVCTDNSWSNWKKGNSRVLEKEMVLDTKPPMVSMVSTKHNLNQGGSGLAVFDVSEDAKRCGVKIGERFFPAYSGDNGHYYCLFSFPYDADPDQDVPRVVAEDRAGNEYSAGFYYYVNAKTFKPDRINIPDSFLRAKMPQFQGDFPEEKDLLELFLKVNRELRRENRERLHSIGLETASSLAIDGPFIRQRGSTRADFADKRTYFYQQEEIDKQTHLGVDLASVAQAQVPAANSGEVVFAGFMGIYGNAVIIDHGLGLQSLYAHLSAIGVERGQEVKKGRIIGRSGATGLAGGDHLHFGVLVSGTPVNPVEWWDRTWIENNILNKLDRFSSDS